MFYQGILGKLPVLLYNISVIRSLHSYLPFPNLNKGFGGREGEGEGAGEGGGYNPFCMGIWKEPGQM